MLTWGHLESLGSLLEQLWREKDFLIRHPEKHHLKPKFAESLLLPPAVSETDSIAMLSATSMSVEEKTSFRFCRVTCLFQQSLIIELTPASYYVHRPAFAKLRQ